MTDFSSETNEQLIERVKSFLGCDIDYSNWTRGELITFIEDHFSYAEENI